jgi:hypothetical protein
MMDAWDAQRNAVLSLHAIFTETIMPQQKLILYGDRVRLILGVRKLTLGNAAKYTPEHGKIWVKVP